MKQPTLFLTQFQNILLCTNTLHINQDKTCFMHFKPKGDKSDDNIDEIPLRIIKNNEIEVVSENKFLGVTLEIAKK